MSRLSEIVADLRRTREDVAFLRNRYRIDLGEIQVGYEYAIESILEMVGFTEEQIDDFWRLSEPDEMN